MAERLDHNRTRGNTYEQLMQLSLPIMGTSLIQMSYNIMDMFWLGKLSTDAVSAAGIAGYLTWLGFSIATMNKVGAEIGVGQSVGRQDKKGTQGFINNSLGLAFIIGVIFSAAVLANKNSVLNFFRVDSPVIAKMATDYLVIVMLAVPVHSLNIVLTGIYHGFGNSRLTFKINTVGLVVNMILDPLLMFGFHMGVAGAALATAISQCSIFILFVLHSREKTYYQNLSPLHGLKKSYLGTIVRWGLPVAGHSIIFAGISSIVARMITSYGTYAFAAQQVGVQIESIGWMTFAGLSTSIGVFVAQSFGAEDEERVQDGIKKGMILATLFGVAISLILYFGSTKIFKWFIEQEETVKLGVLYLKAMAAAQVFSAWEAGAMGSLNGLGKSVYPSITGILGNAARIPLGYLLSARYGVPGIWWAIAGSCMLKGLLPLPFLMYFKRRIPKLLKKDAKRREKSA